MILNKAQDCLEKLNTIFDRTTHDFELANALCDVLYELEKQVNKYTKLKQIILNEHYDLQSDGVYSIKYSNETNKLDEFKNHFAEATRQWGELDNIEFEIEKTTIPKPEYISPRELYYLKEFFNLK